jgi:nucleotide-binding universal stress UspA family protein
MMFTQVLIPADLTDRFPWKVVMPVALNLVMAFNSKLHFVHVIPDFGMHMIEDYLPKHWVSDHRKKCHDALVLQTSKFLPLEIKAHYHVSRGSVYDKIVQCADKIKAELIILPAVRPELGADMLGPNASKIARYANMSVMVVRE